MATTQFNSQYYQPQEDHRVFWNIDKVSGQKEFEISTLHLEVFDSFDKKWRRIDSKKLEPTTRVKDVQSQMIEYYNQSLVDGLFEEILY